MTKIDEILDMENLARMLDEGFINRRMNPSRELYIYNYSNKAQFANAWNHETKTCRGLITTLQGDIVARPFQKTMNYGQVAIPREAVTKPPIVTEKMDGVLGVVYWWDTKWRVATRGSFDSEYAIKAQQMLERTCDVHDPASLSGLGTTSCFEIIYPGARIVVNYGETEELVYLASMDNETGADIFPGNIGWDPSQQFSVAERFDLADLDDIHRLAQSERFRDAEGVVACWPRQGQPSFRLKFKNANYLQLHSLCYGLSSKTIWRALRDGTDFEELLALLPDEYYQWLSHYSSQLERQFYERKTMVESEFHTIMASTAFPDRRSFAAAVQSSPHRAHMFRLYDGKPLDDLLWKELEPPFERPNFRVPDEEM